MYTFMKLNKHDFIQWLVGHMQSLHPKYLHNALYKNVRQSYLSNEVVWYCFKLSESLFHLSWVILLVSTSK